MRRLNSRVEHFKFNLACTSVIYLSRESLQSSSLTSATQFTIVDRTVKESRSMVMVIYKFGGSQF